MGWVKRAGLATAVATSVLSGGTAFAQTNFVEGLNDVPVMPGLSSLGDPLIFDKPGGRIAEVVLTGPVGADSVRTFYTRTLPQLGWVLARPDHFIRDREELTLHLSAHPNASTVRLVIEPYKK